MSNIKIKPETIVKAWNDSEFLKRLKNSPKETLKEEGYDIPENLTINIHQNIEGSINLVLPSKPSQESITADDLIEVASRKLEAQLEMTLY